MLTNRKQLILGSLLFLGTVTFLMITGDLRMIGVTGDQKEPIRTAYHDHGCYAITSLFTNVPHPPEVLKERGCSKRLPDVLIIGSKKCGTTTLKDFLAFHPQIAAADIEAHYYDSHLYMGLDWFKQQLPYALPNQVVIEKTPRYFVYPDVQTKTRRDLSRDIKLIVIVRDPVIRAVSDFTHITFKRYTTEKQKRNTDGIVQPTLTPKQVELRKKFKRQVAANNRMFPNYDKVGITFEESILTANGEIDVNSAIIDTGIYVKHLRKWLQYYSQDQILVLDGELLVVDPAEVMVNIEQFLGLQPYFTREHFHFDLQKRFYCLSQPIFACMKPSKGRVHASVNDETMNKLRQFYEPYNLELQQLLNQSFSWTL